MNLSDKIVDSSVERQLAINRYVGSITRRLNQLLRDIAEDIEDTFRGDIRDYTKAERGKLLTQIKQVTTESMGVFFVTLFTEWEELAGDQAQEIQDSINAIVGFLLLKQKPTDSRLNNIVKNATADSVPVETWFKRLTGDAQFRIQQAITAGLELKETNGQIMARLYDFQNPRSTGPVLTKVGNNLQAIYTTAVADIISSVDEAVYAANSSVIKALVSNAILDNRTTELCAAYHMKQWEFETKQPIGHNLPYRATPRHIRCRSRHTVVLKENVRNGIDGQAPQDRTFDEFLRSKSREYLNEYLGVGRAQLYLDKKLSMTELLDQQGNPLTLAELKARYGR